MQITGVYYQFSATLLESVSNLLSCILLTSSWIDGRNGLSNEMRRRRLMKDCKKDLITVALVNPHLINRESYHAYTLHREKATDQSYDKQGRIHGYRSRVRVGRGHI